MGNLPNWVMDLVIALEKWEEEGHSLTPESNLAEIKAACHHDWLALIPREVRDAADAITEYNRQAAQATTPQPGPPTAAHGRPAEGG